MKKILYILMVLCMLSSCYYSLEIGDKGTIIERYDQKMVDGRCIAVVKFENNGRRKQISLTCPCSAKIGDKIEVNLIKN